MTELFRDPSQSTETRVDDLLARMTPTEKIGQLNERLLGWDVWERTTSGVATLDALDEEIDRWGGIGAIYGVLRADAWSGRHHGNGADPELSAEVTARVQQRIVERSRLGIPALFVDEAPHGHMAIDGTMFPTGTATASTWRPDLIEEAATHTSRELRSRGIHMVLVAGLDMLRDPRWGRAEECYGEDPVLAARCVAAVVRGIQSQPGVGAVLKHFAGQGAGIGGRNSSGAPIGPNELAQIHLPAARVGVEAGALGIMAAYSEIDGVPCIADRRLLTDVLRNDWGFRGVVIADMFAIDRLLRSAPSKAQAGALALRAGVDLSMCDLAYTALEEAVELGLVGDTDVEVSCRRVVETKIRLGLLDPPAALPRFPAPPTSNALAEHALVLLQNDGTTLPADPKSTRLAVVGPNADDPHALLGDYVPPLLDGAVDSVLDALRAAFDGEIVHEPGCELMAAIDGGLERAAAAAAAADLAVIVVGSTGERGYDDDFESNGGGASGGKVSRATTGENYDVAEVRLPDAQIELAAAVAATGTPTVAVVVSGRPLGVEALAESCDAVIYAWYPGPGGGRAIAQLLTGAAVPRGRLSASLPGSSGTLPVAYDERLEIILRYVDVEVAPRWPFGFGLGYGRCRVDRLSISGSIVGDTSGETAGDRADPGTDGGASVLDLSSLVAQVAVTNDGACDDEQTVQLYGRLLVPGVLPRRAVLLGFETAAIPATTTTTVSVPVDPVALDHLGAHGVDDARLEVWASNCGPGHGAEDTLEVQVVGPHL